MELFLFIHVCVNLYIISLNISVLLGVAVYSLFILSWEGPTSKYALLDVHWY